MDPAANIAELCTDPVADVFGKSGILSKKFDKYQPRQGQIDMSQAVWEAMRDEEHLIVEGPCGTGKGFSYLVPAIYHAVQHNKQIVVATANIALQEQLVYKDLPALREALPFDFRFCLFKGKSNYLCHDQHAKFLGEHHKQGHLFEKGAAITATADEKQVLEWEKVTQLGDKSELEHVPHPMTWAKFSVGADECKGKRCRYHDECFAVAARARAAQSHIIVCNFHVLFANMKFMDAVLPPFDICILDESHEVADIARDFLGYRLTEAALGRYARKVKKEFDLKAEGEVIDKEAAMFFASLKKYANSDQYDVRITEEECVPYMGILQALMKAEAALAIKQRQATGDDAKATVEMVRNRGKGFMDSIEAAMDMTDDNFVNFIEIEGTPGNKRAALKGKPINVAGLLRAGFFEKKKTVVMTSATLSVDDSFDHLIHDVGLDGAAELIVESPFIGEQSIFLTPPKGFPYPNDKSFIEKMAEEIVNAIKAANGRTLCLFTSYYNLNRVYEIVEPQVTETLIHKQGDMPRTKLVDMFKEQTNSVLMGTRSFWAGVDVPGESLSLVIVDKLPFPSPADPVLAALNEHYGRQGFFKVSVPRAIIQFKQGAGRLIRSVDDRGCILCFDRRLREKGYGKQFLNSLPAMKLSTDLEEISYFLGCRPWGSEAPALTPEQMDEAIPF